MPLLLLYEASLGLPVFYVLIFAHDIVRDEMKQWILTGVAIMAAVGGLVLLQTVSPSQAGPVGVLAIFLCLYIVTVAVIYFVLMAVSTLVRLVVKENQRVRRLAEWQAVKAYYYASVLGLAPIILLGFQSVGSISWFDVTLVVLFTTLACFYISKR